jgi:hypothetical protein
MREIVMDLNRLSGTAKNLGGSPKLSKDRISVAEFLRQVAPGRAGSHQPKHRIEPAAVVSAVDGRRHDGSGNFVLGRAPQPQGRQVAGSY